VVGAVPDPGAALGGRAELRHRQHVHQIALPAPRNQAALVALLNDIASLPLDTATRGRCMWSRFVGGSALIMRYHHCIGDGGAIMAVFSSFRHDTRASPRAAGARRPAPAARPPLTPAFDAIERAGRRRWRCQRHGRTRRASAAGDRHGRDGARGAECWGGADEGAITSPRAVRHEKDVAWSKPVRSDIKVIGAPQAPR
jgi:hypothetical protein